MIYTATCVMLLMLAAYITWVSGRGSGPWKSWVFWAPNVPFHRTQKLSISRAQPLPTCPHNGCCPHQKHYIMVFYSVDSDSEPTHHTGTNYVRWGANSYIMPQISFANDLRWSDMCLDCVTDLYFLLSTNSSISTTWQLLCKIHFHYST